MPTPCNLRLSLCSSAAAISRRSPPVSCPARPRMGKDDTRLLLFFFALCFCTPSSSNYGVGLATAQGTAAPVPVHVGVILDLHKDHSLVGRMCNTSLAMAVEDFYAKNGHFKTRLVLHPRDSDDDAVGAASAALDLIQNVKVQAILGPMTSVQSVFVIDLGSKTHVPIVSFSASSPSLSPSHSPYFVRMALNSSSQVEAIAAIVKAYGWREVVPVYEDTEYGAGFLPYLVDAFQGVDAAVPYRSAIPPSASDEHIVKELTRLADRQTRVFVVHMLPTLGSRLFLKAKEMGLMEKGYVWITTSDLTDLLGTLRPTVVQAMQWVIGLRPYVPPSRRLDRFTARWKTRFQLENPDAANVTGISTYALWAYDTVGAMAKAVEEAGLTNSTFKQTEASSGSSTDLARLEVSLTGPRLLDKLLKTKFPGLSGVFRLVDGQLQSSTFQVLNVIDGQWREVGFWSPERGVAPELNSTGSTPLPDVGTALKDLIWPGGSRDKPKGWQIPTGNKKLKVAVPAKAGFGEFVHVDSKNSSNATGYCIDVFNAVMRFLNYTGDYEYESYEAQGDSSYDLLVQQVHQGNYDAAVGDITIVADRSQYVDFTLPYTESGVSMIVPIKEDKNKNAWIFLKPLTTDLWLGSMAFFFFTGFVVWVIEHRINEEFRGPPSQQMGTIFYFAFSTMVYAHRERVASKLSRFVVIIWVFVVLILTSSYTASLTSMLTVQQLQPAVASVNELLKNGDYVGYQDGSFVKGLLMRLNFEESKLVPLVNTSQYAEALSKGSQNGGVAAIFDEIPYIKIFLREHCHKFVMVDPTYKTDGFGFVFPRGSPLVPDVSRAILSITEGDNNLQGIDTWLGMQTTCMDQMEALDSSRLSFRSFWGLFLITGGVSFLALVIFFVTYVCRNWEVLKSAASDSNSLREKIKSWARHYDQKDLSCHTFKQETGDHKLGCHCGSRARTPERSTQGDGSQSPQSISVHSFMNFGAQEEGRPSTSSEREAGRPAVVQLPQLEPATIEVTQTRDC